MSNKVASLWTAGIISDVKEHFIEKLRNSQYYSVQLDDRTDIRIFEQFLPFVRYEDEGSVKEELVFCESLNGRTTAKDSFEKIDLFMKSHNID